MVEESGKSPAPAREGLPAEINGAVEEVSGPEGFRLASSFKGHSQAIRGALVHAHREGECSMSKFCILVAIYEAA